MSVPARIFALFLSLCALLAMIVPGFAQASGALRTVRYDGATLQVPRGWPVIHLGRDGTTCVRFNRHALYLGALSPREVCPVASAGRTEAILAAPTGSASAGIYGDDVTLRRIGRVQITATWGQDPATIRRALGTSHLVTALRPAHSAAVVRRALARSSVSSSSPATPGAVYAGQGFDACSTPSESTMSTWGTSSPYGAVGVYIGGVNMACSQPNLTASWVSTESAAGWHIVPIYVGEQAPSNSCGCSSITASQASAEGTAAATDAVYDAQEVGLGTGNPLYYDMEGYTRNSANSTAVLSFLAAWTTQLHADGYASGVYSSDDSGIADLVAENGTGYPEPDDIWIANWNGEANTADATVPTGDWANNQRLHQYQGGVNETYGGIEINVDNDYLDGNTAGFGSGSATVVAVSTPPVASSTPALTGVPVVGQTLTEGHATWSESPTAYAYQWYRCTGSGTDCAPVSGATGQTYTLSSADEGDDLLVVESASNSLGSGKAVSSGLSAPVAAATSGFWAFTATGAIENSLYQLTWGSPSGYGLKDVVGLAASPGRTGYWVTTRYGTVYAFGSAATLPVIRVSHPVSGIVRSPTNGYWLWTSRGNVYASRGTGYYGSPARLKIGDIAGMAAVPNAPGYWLVTRIGTVFAYGAATRHPAIHPAHAVIGIVAAPQHGYWLYTADGEVYPSHGAPYYGSAHRANIASMLATPDGRGYWLITHSGHVYAFGDAGHVPAASTASGAIVGIAG